MTRRLAEAVDWIDHRFRIFGLPVWFAVLATSNVWVALTHGWVGLDFRIYRLAAQNAAWGLDPYSATIGGFRYDAPPPTTLMYLPLTVIPELAGAVLIAIASVAAAAYALRRLHLPIYWLLFPPIAESIVTLNPDVIVIAILVAPGWSAVLGPMIKLYALVPLVWSGRIRVAIGSIALTLFSYPLWAGYLADIGGRATVLERQANGYSAWSTWLLVPAIAALLVLRRRGGGWLAVPTAWPYSQLHYSCIALPALSRRPWLAAAMSVGIPLLTPAAVIATATYESLRGGDHPFRS